MPDLFQKNAILALRFFLKPSQGTFEALHQTRDYWQSFISDYQGDITLRDCILKTIDEGDENLLEPRVDYLRKLAQDPQALPKDDSQPKKQKPKN